MSFETSQRLSQRELDEQILLSLDDCCIHQADMAITCLERNRSFAIAADRCLDYKWWSRAINNYARAKQFEDAGFVYEKLGRVEDAIHFYHKAGWHDEAARLSVVAKKKGL